MCACVEPVGTAIGAVCVEYGRPKWPITMLNHTRCTEECFVFYFWHPMLVRPVMNKLFFPWKTKEYKARYARAPHDKNITSKYFVSTQGSHRPISFMMSKYRTRANGLR